MFEKIERAVFFTMTRVFAWLVILPAFLALVYGGYKVAATYSAGQRPVEVTYEDVRAEMERLERPWDAQVPPAEVSEKEKADEWRYEAQLEELLGIFGEQVDRQKAAKYFRSIVMRQAPGDRAQFIKGLVRAVKSAPPEKRLQVVDIYEELWERAAVARDAEQAAAKGGLASQLWVLGSAFGVVSLFSLILILLAIEKNTRNVRFRET